ncbi:hypothetical protein ACFCZ1_29615 [Streptomyces sp. NPDC056224]|uniref:hypothetical protein n=1 Tax=Streptomyces sp. NPDC056224 TaxID=3345750 RepID=UPI0035E3868A
MSHDLHTPAAGRTKRRIARLGMALTSAAFVSGAVALPASAVTAPSAHASVVSVRSYDDPNREPGGGAYGPNTCKQGYVWRDSYEGDVLCVTPDERRRAHDANPNRQPGGGAYGPATCLPGYVWRDSFDGDTLCVTPAERQQARDYHGSHLVG